MKEIIKYKENKIYNKISIDNWLKLTNETELNINNKISLQKIISFDFNDCSINLRNGDKIYFDGLSENQFVHVCNGGYYEEVE